MADRARPCLSPTTSGPCRGKRASLFARSHGQDRAVNPRIEVEQKPNSNPAVVRSMAWDPAHPSREVLLNREGLVTRGRGGFASGPVSGAVTRKYHGFLVPAPPAP